MATQAMCTSYKGELMRALHNHTQTSGHVFKCALYTSSSTKGKATTAYTTPDATEITNTSGTAYVTGGFSWTAAQNITPVAGVDASYTSWTVNPSWSSASFTADSCLIYNSSSSNRAVCVLTFGGPQTVTAGTFTIQLPTNGEATSVLRITA
jgi:hypothetical protein